MQAAVLPAADFGGRIASRRSSSRRQPVARNGEVVEGPVLAVQHGNLSDRLLPPPHDHVDIAGVDLQQHRMSLKI